jgi:3-hydroxybutyryl-CoA dehydrogenase
MAIKTVGVLGCGLMGAGIAQVSAASGYKTIVREVNQAALDKGLGRIKKFLDGGVEKGKVTPEQRDTTVGNLSGVTDLGAMGSCDLIIEAIIENIDELSDADVLIDVVDGPNVSFPDQCQTRLPVRKW